MKRDTPRDTPSDTPRDPPDDTILQETRDGVTILTLNRPRQRNAFNTQMYGALAAAFDEARDDPRVRVVVVTGSEGAFSAGQDLAEMGRLAERRPESGEGSGFPRLMDALLAFDKPLVAAVNGVGVGLGFTLLLHCDLVYMADDARLRLPFVTLGVVPEAASSVLLPAVVGQQAAADLVYTGAWVDARRAATLGIAYQVCAPADLLPTARAKAAEIAAGPLGALRRSKRLLRATRDAEIRGARAREDAAFAACIGSDENLEAIRAFLEKRPPDFSRRGD
jgi:enoyl-CoA hydratase/carnithine racemase